MIIRTLQEEDFDKGFLKILENLTVVGDVSRDEFERRWEEIMFDNDYYIYVAEKDGQIVGTATLLIRRGFIHHCGQIGHIEEVVTGKQFEKQGVASALMEKLIEVAQKRKCYKVILDCSDEVIPFYEKFGFKKKDNQMRLDFTSP